MKKLYYTCPIEAAYMTKNFGIIFDDEYRIFVNLESIGMYLDFDILKDDIKHYIHPESLSIFEPQVGDLVRIDIAPFHDFIIMNSYFLSTNCEIKEIIQRNGRAFIMPEAQN